MDHRTHHDHGQMSDPHAGHQMTRDHRSHDRHAGHSVAMFRDKFWLSFALTIPTVFWSPEVQHWLGYTAPSFSGSRFIPAIFGTAVFLYGGLVFLRGAQGELADRKPGMMTLISLAIIVAFGTSLAATVGFFQVEVWWELTSLITIMVLGHWLEMRAISQAQGALNALAIDGQIHELAGLRDTLRHVAACRAPSHLECPTFRRLVDVAGKRARSGARKQGAVGNFAKRP